MIPAKDVNLYTGKVSVTGSQAVSKPSGENRIVSVQVTPDYSTATLANRAINVGAKVAADGQSFTIYAWKATAANDVTLIAATAAVDVEYLVITERFPIK